MENMRVGEIREWNNKRFKCVDRFRDDCAGCAFEMDDDGCVDSESILGSCMKADREDGVFVIFQECQETVNP